MIYELEYFVGGKYEKFYFKRLKHAFNYANSLMDEREADYNVLIENDEIKYRIDYEDDYADIIFIKKIHIMDED